MSEDAPLEAFFVQFASLGFSYNRSKTAHKNFKRLQKSLPLDESSPQFAIVRTNFKDALVQQFNFIYGADDDDLQAWQKLCSAIDIAPVPDDIDECRKLVWDANVNIVDLLESARTGKKVQKFATLEKLRVYTKKPGKMFPKENAYAGGLLKELLREIVNPYFGKRRNGGAKRKGRKARKRAAAAAAAQAS